MILSITSSDPRFKSTNFHRGLNVLLADTRPDSTKRQTRNSAGKSSLLEIIHFLHGADCDKHSMFRTNDLIGHKFTADLLVRGKRLAVERSGADHSKVFIVEGGDTLALPKRFDKDSGRTYVSNTNWRAYLGHEMFSLPAESKDTIYDEPFKPTFRSMFSYFVRRRSVGGFSAPERQSGMQQAWDWQVNLSYLFGLDWEIPSEFQKIRGRERTITELKRAVKAGAFGEMLGTVAELRAQLAIAESRVIKIREQLADFHVLESYRDLSRRAGGAKTEMQSISRRAVSLVETQEHLRRALENERPPEKSDLRKLYEAVGVELPGVAIRRFEDVDRFYDSVIQNRRSHLEEEILDVTQQLAEGDRRLAALDEERSAILRRLSGHGALEDFVDLQRRVAEYEALVASLRERFKAAQMLEGEATQLVIDRANLKRRLQEDHQERKTILEEAILIVAETISELYDDRIGRLVIDATDNGPEFRISIEGDRGGGISSMEIFCLDFTLLQLTSRRLGGPGLLVHDSHLFDGVDERQISRALDIGWREAQNSDFQYIVTMNSDIFDRLPLPDTLDRNQIVLGTRLSDETDGGGLFGFRFN